MRRHSEILASARPSWPQDITPPPPQNYEMRVIIWEAKDVKYDGLEAFTTDIADLYVHCFVEQAHSPDSKRLSTDTHFRAARGKASWNYRLKFPVTLKPDSSFTRIHFELWDCDLFSADDPAVTPAAWDRTDGVFGSYGRILRPPTSHIQSDA